MGIGKPICSRCGGPKELHQHDCHKYSRKIAEDIGKYQTKSQKKRKKKRR